TGPVTMAPYPTATVTSTLGTGSIVSGAVKADINIAGFSELWRAFWSVMADADAVGTTVDTSLPPFPAAAARMFRNSVRNAPATLDPSEMMQLRSALAAVNAMDLRDNDDIAVATTLVCIIPGNISSPEIPLITPPAALA